MIYLRTVCLVMSRLVMCWIYVLCFILEHHSFLVNSCVVLLCLPGSNRDNFEVSFVLERDAAYEQVCLFIGFLRGIGDVR